MKLTKKQRVQLTELLRNKTLDCVENTASKMLNTKVLLNITGYRTITLYDGNNDYKVIARLKA